MGMHKYITHFELSVPIERDFDNARDWFRAQHLQFDNDFSPKLSYFNSSDKYQMSIQWILTHPSGGKIEIITSGPLTDGDRAIMSSWLRHQHDKRAYYSINRELVTESWAWQEVDGERTLTDFAMTGFELIEVE